MPKKKLEQPTSFDRSFWTCGSMTSVMGSNVGNHVMYNHNQTQRGMSTLLCTHARHERCLQKKSCDDYKYTAISAVDVRRYHNIKYTTWEKLPEVEQRMLKVLAGKPGRDALAACRQVRVTITEEII